MQPRNPLENDPKIQAWIQLVKSAGCVINSVKPLTMVRKPDGSLLFGLLDADIRSPEGASLPNIAFIRGDACLIVPLARNRETGEERFVMITQRRTGNGSLSLEFPAGMLDAAILDPVGVAVRELAEETGLSVARADLFPLCGRPLFSSVGACDEAIHYFGCILLVDDAVFRSLDNRKCGSPHEEEHITVVLKSRTEAEAGTTSLQARLGLYLFDEWRKKKM